MTTQPDLGEDAFELLEKPNRSAAASPSEPGGHTPAATSGKKNRRSGRKHRRRLHRPSYRTGLAILSGVFFVVLLIVAAFTHDFDFGKSAWAVLCGEALRAILWGLGVALIGALVFDFLYARPAQAHANRELRRAVKQQLAHSTEEITRNTRKVTAVVAQMNRRYYPSEYFGGSEKPDPELNRAIKQDLLRTRSYYFQGTGGEWTAMRLERNSNRIASVTLVLPDLKPQADHYHDLIQYEVNLPRNREKNLSVHQVRMEMGKRIGSALAGLFENRFTTDVEVHFTNRNFDYRLEIMEDVAYVCDFDRQDPERPPYPATVRFDRDSFSFKFLEYVATIPAPGKRVFAINASTPEEALLDLIEDLELSDLTPKDALETYKARYQDFVNQNAKYIDRTYIGG